MLWGHSSYVAELPLWLMLGDAEYAWLGSTSAYYQYRGVHFSSGLARSPAFSFGGRWGFRSLGASVTTGGTSWGHSRGYSTNLTSHFTSFGGLWGGGWRCWCRLCSWYDRNIEHLGFLACYRSGDTPASLGCSLLTSWRACTSPRWADIGIGGAMTGFPIYFSTLDTFYF